jgi:hypothetical protein
MSIEANNINWTAQLSMAIKEGKVVPLGVLLWTPESDTMRVISLTGSVQEIRAMICGYVRSEDEQELSTALGNDDDEE